MVASTPCPLLVQENGRLKTPHYWNHITEILSKPHYWDLYIVLFCTIRGKVEFINPHYREICTMGGRINRGFGGIQ